MAAGVPELAEASQAAASPSKPSDAAAAASEASASQPLSAAAASVLASQLHASLLYSVDLMGVGGNVPTMTATDDDAAAGVGGSAALPSSAFAWEPTSTLKLLAVVGIGLRL